MVGSANEALELAEAEAQTSEHTNEEEAGSIKDRALCRLVVRKRLVAARLLNGMSQTEAALAIGYSNPTQLSQWETGQRPPPTVKLIAFADAMNVSLDYLFGRADDPERDVRMVRKNACLRAIRSVLVSATERIVEAFDADESVTGLNMQLVRDLVRAADVVSTAHNDLLQARRAGSGEMKERLSTAIDQLDVAVLKAGLAIRQHDDEDARMKARLAEIAANEGAGGKLKRAS